MFLNYPTPNYHFLNRREALWRFAAIFSPARFWIETGTLVLIGFAEDGITLAADSGVFHNGQLVTVGFRKIHPVTRFGAAAVVGANRTALSRSGHSQGEFNVGDILDAHAQPQAESGFRQACRDRIDVLSRELQRLVAKADDNGSAGAGVLFSVYFAGYEDGKPLFISADVRWPRSIGGKAGVKLQEIQPPPGFFQGFGKDRVAKEILLGHGSAFQQYKNSPVVRKLHERVSEHATNRFTYAEFLELSKVCLDATESKAGAQYDQTANYVSPPNVLAVITPQSGFRWEEQKAAHAAS